MNKTDYQNQLQNLEVRQDYQMKKRKRRYNKSCCHTS